MIEFSIVEYIILGTVIAAIILKVLSDSREIADVKMVKNAVKKIAEKNFSPTLTILLPIESYDETKATLEHLSKMDFPKMIVVVDTKKHVKNTRALRYFVKKRSLSSVKVITRKQFNPTEVAGKYAKRDMAVVLPDTVRLSSSFYRDTIFAFGDGGVDALLVASSIRPNNTLSSGVEVLFAAWRRYVGLAKSRVKNTIKKDNLPQGVIIRAKYLRRMPENGLQCMQIRKAAYSVAPQKSFSASWRQLQDSTGLVDLATVIIMSLAVALLLQRPDMLPLSLGAFAIIFGTIVWWSISIARISLLDRLSLLLLSPLFLAVAWALVIFHFSQALRREQTI